MRTLNDFNHPKLDVVAKGKDKRYARWVGIRSGSSKRRYVCHLCGMQIDAESAKYPMTKHAYESIYSHMAFHLGGHF